MALVVPDNEVARLAALFRYKILDSEEDEVYTTICSLAASIMETPIALISLVAENRQWFKSKIGIAIDETPREFSFCSHAILTPNEPLIVKDATLDDRFAENPYVTGDPKIRFYCGSPLVTADNEAIGTICTLDSVPRKTPTQFQVESMQKLSRLVMAQLELRESIMNVYDTASRLKNIQFLPENTETITEAYTRLNSSCDEVLQKIKARKEK